MKTKPFGAKPRAQTMVEFALVLPLLLTLIYGVIETGRLLFIYSSTITAARQAVRYGSATGTGPNGVAYYRDCAGIRQAAKNVGFINTFNDSDITITYDHGLLANGNVNNFSGSTPTCGSNPTLANGDRIVVQVTTQWTPLVPLVPLQPFTITSTSERTILLSVDIAVTAPVGGMSGTGNGVIGLSFTLSPTSYNTVGQQLTYAYTITNTGTGDLSGPFTVSDIAGVTTNCTASAPSTLSPGASFTCSGTYTIAQSDLDNGSVTNGPTASATGSSASATGQTAYAAQTKSLTLAAGVTPNYTSNVGDVVLFTYSLTNTGNVTLTSPYSVTDNKISNVDCSGATSPLAPGASTSCEKTYAITTADVNAGSITAQSSATAKFGASTVTSNNSSATVITRPLTLSITASPLNVSAAGQVITYTYLIQNTSNFTFTSPYTFYGYKGTAPNCSGAQNTLNSGESTSCTGTYTTTQADIDAGLALVNSAYVVAKNGAANVTSNTTTASVAVNQNAAVSLSISPNPTVSTVKNSTITYTYTITNTGYVTLSQPFSISEDRVTGISCLNPNSLAPGATTTCTGTTTVKQQDLDAGKIVDNAQASAKFGNQTITSTQVSGLVITYSGPRLSLSISANPTSVTGAGSVIVYTYTITNSGSVSLTNPSVSGADCSLATSPLAPGASTTCTGTYTTTNTDVSNGSVTHTTTASAKNGVQTVTSSSASVTVTVNSVTSCDVKHSVIRIPPTYQFGIIIYNNNSYAITVSQIQAGWNDTPNSQRISQVTLGGSTIWSSNSNNGSPTTFSSLSGNTSISAQSNKLLEFTFNSTYTPFSPTQEYILVNFAEAGCPQLNSGNASQLQ